MKFYSFKGIQRLVELKCNFRYQESIISKFSCRVWEDSVFEVANEYFFVLEEFVFMFICRVWRDSVFKANIVLEACREKE